MKNASKFSGWHSTFLNCITRFIKVVVAFWAVADEPPEYNRSSIEIFLFKAKIKEWLLMYDTRLKSKITIKK